MKVTDKELMEELEIIEEDLIFHNEQLRACEDLVDAHKKAIDKYGEIFHNLINEAKYRKLLK